ncbi:MAG TPA: DUF2195 family protein [Cellvibrionaceae bacterium]
MATLKFNSFLILLLVSCACTAKPSTADIRIDNALDECQHITQQTINLAPIPTIKLDYQTHASTAQCGCKSMLNSYKVAIKFEGYTRTVLSGSFIFPAKSPITLPLATQPELIKGQSLEINIACETQL